MTSPTIDAIQQFEAIRIQLTSDYADVAPGKMMSREAITWEGQVFAFYRKGEMVFRLGRDADLNALGIPHATVLAPFKSKPPMHDWFCVSVTDSHQWAALARHALARLRLDREAR